MQHIFLREDPLPWKAWCRIFWLRLSRRMYQNLVFKVPKVPGSGPWSTPSLEALAHAGAANFRFESSSRSCTNLFSFPSGCPEALHSLTEVSACIASLARKLACATQPASIQHERWWAWKEIVLAFSAQLALNQDVYSSCCLPVSCPCSHLKA